LVLDNGYVMKDIAGGLAWVVAGVRITERQGLINTQGKCLQ
jgi:hypothetical protein